MIKKKRNYIVLILKGIAMGAADVVPGVSGGTIAFISGIYEELLTSISNINFKLVEVFKNGGFKDVWKKINGNFLASIFSGIIISFLSLAKVILWLLHNTPILLWSFFFGLVLASIFFVIKKINKWNFIVFLLVVFGSLVAYYITSLKPLLFDSSTSLFLFFSGALAICAMILPGISGSFILVILGSYKPILNAIKNFEIQKIFILGLGALLGILVFSKFLKFLFNTYKNYTLATLTGFIIGSLNKIWPWKEVLDYRINSKGIKVPLKELSISPFSFNGDSKIFYAVFLFILGFILIFLLEKLALKNK